MATTAAYWLCNGKKLDLGAPRVMGILNASPESFSSGSQMLTLAELIDAGRRMADDGAAVIDIGGESTRPGSRPLGVQEELDRVAPLVEALKGGSALISVDTYKAEVMREVIRLGADIINDVNALESPGALEAVADSEVGLVLMHKRGTPETMQKDTAYDDVVAEVLSYLEGRAKLCEKAGIKTARIALDYGFGFGKDVAGNFRLLAETERFTLPGYPVLVGFSRKSSLGAVTGRPVHEREAATVAAHLMAVERGARIVRTHDVRAAVDSIAVWVNVHRYTSA